MLRRLDHINIVRFYGGCLTLPHIFIVSELMHTSLQRIVHGAWRWGPVLTHGPAPAGARAQEGRSGLPCVHTHIHATCRCIAVIICMCMGAKCTQHGCFV